MSYGEDGCRNVGVVDLIDDMLAPWLRRVDLVCNNLIADVSEAEIGGGST